MKNRDSFLDFAKGILIALVVIGHVIQYGSGTAYLENDLYYENGLMKYIYSFHMPLFMYISGWLTYGSFVRKGAAAAFLERIKMFIVPIAVWAPIICVLNVISGNSTAITIKNLIGAFFTGFWFLWAVLLSTFIAYILYRFQKREARAVIYAIFLAAALATPDIYWTHAYKFVIPFFLIGFSLARYSKNYIVRGGALWCVFFLALLPFFNQQSYIYTTKFSLLGKAFGHAWLNQITIDLYRFFIGLSGCFAHLFIWKYAYDFIKQKKFLSLFIWFGKNSLSIYILTTYQFVFLIPIVTASWAPRLYIQLIEAIAILTVTSLVTLLIKKSTIISRMLLGEKTIRPR